MRGPKIRHTLHRWLGVQDCPSQKLLERLPPPTRASGPENRFVPARRTTQAGALMMGQAHNQQIPQPLV
eukprot:scaffold244438_cov41-Prasinocladus_malaysianus.AAC.2